MGDRRDDHLKQPVPLPAAGQPRLTTPRGHIKAIYLTREQLEQIIDNLDAGMNYHDACHQVGTSHARFMSAVRRYHPDLQPRVTEVKKRRRQKSSLSSEYEPPGTATTDNDASGLHQGEVPD